MRRKGTFDSSSIIPDGPYLDNTRRPVSSFSDVKKRGFDILSNTPYGPLLIIKMACIKRNGVSYLRGNGCCT